MKPARRTTCGVVITDGARVLLGHATRSPRWDIPKGLAEPREDFRSAAIRKLGEETGLSVAPDVLTDLGVHRYQRDKDLALFGWPVARLPEPSTLHCRSLVVPAFGKPFPEFDRFGLFSWDAALRRWAVAGAGACGTGPGDATGRLNLAPASRVDRPRVSQLALRMHDGANVLAVMSFPTQQHAQRCSNNPLERRNRETARRSHVAGGANGAVRPFVTRARYRYPS